MPPKRNDKKTIVNLSVDQEQDDILNSPVQSEDRKMASFEDALDRRLKQQSEFLTDLFTKFFKTMKDELNEFGKRTSDYVNECQCMLESMVPAWESGMENVKQYIRRDMLELHGIPVKQDDNPNEIVKSVVNLLDRGYQVQDQDIPSVTDCQPQRVKSHR